MFKIVHVTHSFILVKFNATIVVASQAQAVPVGPRQR